MIWVWELLGWESTSVDFSTPAPALWRVASHQTWIISIVIMMMRRMIMIMIMIIIMITSRMIMMMMVLYVALWPEYRRWRVKMWRWEDEDDSRVRENWGKLDSMTSVLFAGFFPFYLVVNPSNLTGCENPLCETDLDKNIIFYYSKKKAIYWLRGPIPKKYINGYFSTDLSKWAQID